MQYPHVLILERTGESGGEYSCTVILTGKEKDGVFEWGGGGDVGEWWDRWEATSSAKYRALASFWYVVIPVRVF